MVKLSAGDIIRIEITGRLRTDRSVFETTDEKLALESGIHSSASKYGPRLVIVGKGAMIAGLEDVVPALEIGAARDIAVPADKGFGQRHAELVRVMPQKEFERHGVRASNGMMVTIDGVPALVKSASSGRVMLDFNHPLAGQDLDYSVKLLEVITDPAKKAQALAEQFDAQIKIEDMESQRRIVVASAPDTSKAKGLEAALRASLGDWAKIELSR